MLVRNMSLSVILMLFFASRDFVSRTLNSDTFLLELKFLIETGTLSKFSPVSYNTSSLLSAGLVG